MKNKYQSLLLLSTLVCLNSNGFSADTDSVETKENIINITVPKAPDAPKVQAVVPTVNLIVEGQEVSELKVQPTEEVTPQKEENTSAYGIIDGKRFPPNYYKKDEAKSSEKIEVGEVKNAKIAAYLQGPLISKDEVKSKLEAAGFTLLASYKIDKKGTVTSMVFTDQNISAAAAKESRGFAGSLRLLVDEKNSQISISNPIYVMKAFMQDEYDNELATQTLKRLRDNFDGLQNSKDVVKFIRLPRYKFMNSMPVYEDMKEVASGKNETLLAKARQSKAVIYEQKLSNGSTVIGVKLSKRTSKFVKKTGYQNSELLPYPILIENNKAKILAPKYYIAVMYPLLTMSEFMTIATIPGAIEKDCDKIFR
ncbi:MAG: hypothetical protein WBF77_02885 [Sulfurimonadaceae bacterium]